MNNFFEADFHLDLINVKKKISEVQNLSHNKLCVYTCLIGEFDDFIDISYSIDGYDSFIITDNERLHLLTTNAILIKSVYRSPRRTNRVFKILPHLFFSSYEKSVYYDCNLIYNVSPIEVLALLNPGYDFAIFNHKKRDCLFDEIDECIFWNKDSKSLLNSQKKAYEFVPRKSGLYLGSVLVRNHNNLKEFSEFWWLQYDKFSARDQISLAYSFFITSIKLDVLNINYFEFYFTKVKHTNNNVNESKISIFQRLKFEILIFIVNLRNKF